MSRVATPRIGPTAAVISLVVGGAVAVTGAGMLLSAFLAELGDGAHVLPFAVGGLLSLLAGLGGVALARTRRRASTALNPYSGFAAVTLAWVVAAGVGSAPLLITGTFDNPINAYFEAMSGFTTTGATLIENYNQPDVVFLWRSIMQWLGGIGIVVLVVAIAPVSGTGFQRVFYAETSGVTSERLTPRIIDTAKILAGVYLALTLAAFLIFDATGMNAFEALNHTMTTISTGGFSTEPASIAAFDSVGVEIAAIVFMILAGINFAFYWRAIKGRDLMPQLSEVRLYLSILAMATTAVTISVLIAGDIEGIGESIRESAFAVVSLTTGTGFVTADFDLWNTFSRILLLSLMFVGACAGSASGGLKVIRVSMLLKSSQQEIERQLRPNAVQVLRVGGRTFSEDARRAVLGFFLLYVIVYALGSVAMGATGVDPITAISGAATTLNIVGPGLGEIGATDSFGAIPEGGRVVGTLLMLIGRLEIFTVVALFAPLFRIRRGMI